MNPSTFIGRIVGEYRILSLAGKGGMGTVFKARHELLARDVAIKMLDDVLSVGDTYSSERFIREAKSIAQLTHCHIAKFHAFFVLDEMFPCIVMEWLDGKSLANLLYEETHLSYKRATNIAYQLADALNYAHKLGIVHRDLKPDNLMLLQLPEPDYVKLVDFGLAEILEIGAESNEQKLTNTGALVGTPEYMSPEQCRGQLADERSDIYALGCILYKMITGVAPFEASSPIGLLYKHTSEEVSKPSLRSTNQVPAALELVIMKCLEKKPEDRYQSMEELQAVLAAVANLDGTQNPILPSNLPLTVNKKLLIASAILVFLFLTCALVMSSTALQHRTSDSAFVPAKTQKPEDIPLYFDSGMRLADRSPSYDHKKTISDLQKLIPTIKIKSRLFLAYNCLAKAFEQENQHAKALEALSKARELCKQDNGGYSLDACVCDSALAEWLFERKKFEEAKIKAKEVLLRLAREESGAEDSELQFPIYGFGLKIMENDNTYLLACIAAEQKDWKAAEKYAKKTMQLDSSEGSQRSYPTTTWDYRAVVFLADLYLAKDEAKKAMQLIDNAVEKDLPKKLHRADKLIKKKKGWNEIVRYSQSAKDGILLMKPDETTKLSIPECHHYALSFHQFGEWYAKHGEIAKARKCFVQCIEVYEEHLRREPFIGELISRKAYLAEFDQKNHLGSKPILK